MTHEVREREAAIDELVRLFLDNFFGELTPADAARKLIASPQWLKKAHADLGEAWRICEIDPILRPEEPLSEWSKLAWII